MAKDQTNPLAQNELNPFADVAPSGDQRMTYDEFMEMDRIRSERRRTNKSYYAGVVTKLNAMPPSPRKNKEGAAVLDDNGQPTFWDAIYFATVASLGDELKVMLNAQQVQDIEEDGEYLFIGKLKDGKFRCATVEKI